MIATSIPNATNGNTMMNQSLRCSEKYSTDENACEKKKRIYARENRYI